MPFAIKAAVAEPGAERFAFSGQKTMYGGKHVLPGDTIFVFASENDGGAGLIACGAVTSVQPVAPQVGRARQTPRVSVTIVRTSLAARPLGRKELRGLTERADRDPGAELNFKLYRQATNKIVGISEEAAAYLKEFFCPGPTHVAPENAEGARPAAAQAAPRGSKTGRPTSASTRAST